MLTPFSRSRAAVCAALILLLTPTVASRAFAQPSGGDKHTPTDEQLAQARKAYLEGAALYDLGEKAPAVEKFKESYRLSRNPVLLYNVAVTLDELKQLELALFYYEKFLKDAPKDAAQRPEATKRLPTLRKEVEALTKVDGDKVDATKVDAVDATKVDATKVDATKVDATKVDGDKVDATGVDGDEVDGDKPDATKTDGDKVDGDKPDATKKHDSFMHQVVDEAPPGKPLDITAFAPEGSGWQVTLFFRAAGELKFTSASMRPRYNELVGRIPARKMAGVSVQYYIEVRNNAGATIARSGKATSPNLIFLDEHAKARFYPDLGDEADLGDTGGGAAGAAGDGDGSPLLPVRQGDGFTDVGSDKFKYAKWGSTIVAGTSLALSIVFYLSASNATSELEAQAASSIDDDCPTGPPCRPYDDTQKDIAAYGERYETLTNVALFSGLLASGVAGYYWYKEIKAGKQETARPAGVALGASTVWPVVTDDFVGGAAALRF